MNYRAEAIFLVFLLVFFSFLFQIQFKIFISDLNSLISSLSGPWVERLGGVWRQLVWWRLLLVLALAFGLFAVWALMVARMDLSIALPLASLTLVTNAIGGGLLLGEALSPLRVAGVLLVAIGIAVVLNS